VDEIQKFGQMVLGLIGKLVRRKQEQQYDFSLSLADQEFESEAGFSLRMLVGMDSDNLSAFISNHPELTPANLDLLAGLLIEIADDPGSDSTEYLTCALRLLDKADESDRTFSMERQEKRMIIGQRVKGDA